MEHARLKEMYFCLVQGERLTLGEQEEICALLLDAYNAAAETKGLRAKARLEAILGALEAE